MKAEIKDSLLNYVVNYLSSGVIANYSPVNDYKTIDLIRLEMIKSLKKKDQEYIHSTLIKSIKRATSHIYLGKNSPIN